MMGVFEESLQLEPLSVAALICGGSFLLSAGSTAHAGMIKVMESVPSCIITISHKDKYGIPLCVARNLDRSEPVSVEVTTKTLTIRGLHEGNNYAWFCLWG
jgi:hypothetical protein